MNYEGPVLEMSMQRLMSLMRPDAFQTIFREFEADLIEKESPKMIIVVDMSPMDTSMQDLFGLETLADRLKKLET